MIDCKLLGTTSVLRDGETRDSFLTGPKRLGVFAYLLLARPRSFHRRDVLLPLFWPHHGQRNARNALSNMLYHLRKDLGEDIIVNRGAEEVGVARDAVLCDALAFESALDAGDREHALSLYRGELLSGFHVPDAAPAFHHWLDRERSRLHERAETAAWNLCTETLKAGDRRMARHWARRAAAFSPCSDDAQRRLIALLCKTGDRAGAQSAYRAYADRLRDELDMEPAPQVTALLEESSGDSLPPDAHDLGGIEAEVPKADVGVGHTVAVDAGPLRFPLLHLSRDTRPSTIKNWIVGGAVGLLGLVLFALAMGQGRATTPPAEAEMAAVAVLPFTYLGAPDSTDYFSLGVTEEILTRLSQISDQPVISRTSVMKYQDGNRSIGEIGQELGARAVVEGSVQRAGSRVRITAQLIDARTDHHLWSASYDRNVVDILDMQRDVAIRIAESLHATLAPAATRPGERVNETAYDLYLRAQRFRDYRNPSGIERALRLYEQSVAQDPTFASAHAGLALAYVRAGIVARMDRRVVKVAGVVPEEAARRALQSARMALERDPRTTEAHLARALVFQLFERDWDRSQQAFEEARRVQPNHSEVIQEYGWMWLRLGETDRAEDLMRRAVRIDPHSAMARMGLGHVLYCQRRYESAVRELETALHLGSGDPMLKKYIPMARYMRGAELMRAGQVEAADRHLQRADDVMSTMWGPDETRRQLFRHAARGEMDEARSLFETADLEGAVRMWALRVTEQRERVLETLGSNFIWSVFANPYYDSVRDDPRFEQIVEAKLGVDVDVSQR